MEDQVTRLMSSISGAFDDAVSSLTSSINTASLEDRLFNANREDTQYQRLVSDLEKAGLNKWLAVNGSASPSAQAISNTSEARSRASEVGVKYYDLMEKMIDVAWKNGNQTSKNVLDFIAKVAGLAFFA